MADLVNPNQHSPGEVNPSAWQKAAVAKDVLRARRMYTHGQQIDLAAVDAEAKSFFEKTAARQADQAALSRDTQTNLLENSPLDPTQHVLERIEELRQIKPGTPEFTRRYSRGSSAPEVVSFGYAPDGAEGFKRSCRLWACDSDTIDCVPLLLFHKQAGEEMTDEEFAAVCLAQRPMQWDKDNEPTAYAPLHDSREFEEENRTGRVSTEPIPDSVREAAKQYPVHAYIPEGMGGPNTPATEHVILPDPPVID